jgi:phosphate starvation-inducible PhoH-like protein
LAPSKKQSQAWNADDEAPQVEVSLQIDGVAMVRLLGTEDRLLRSIEKRYPQVSVLARGNQIILTGRAVEVEAVTRIIEELSIMVVAGENPGEEEINASADVLENEGTQAPSPVLGTPIVSSRGKSVRAKTLGQKEYVDAIDSNTIVFGIGPAGTGKTYLAMAKAVQALHNKEVERIILTRPAVEAGERLGFLPGTLTDKIDPYLRPLYDALHDMMDPELVPKLVAAGTIEVAPLAYMRGRTLNNAFIVLDEAQNTTPEQMKMFLTRLGFGSKMVVTGDITQVDLPAGSSGLRLVSRVLTDIDDIGFVRLTSADVVRHSLVARIVDAYTEYDAQKQALRYEAEQARDFASRATPRTTHIKRRSS